MKVARQEDAGVRAEPWGPIVRDECSSALIGEPRTGRSIIMMMWNEAAPAVDIDECLDDDSQERRRGLRVRDHRPVKIYDPGAARYFGGQTEDISATGLRIEMPIWASVRTGETLTIHVGLNSRGQSLANRRNMVPARVVWVNRTPGKRARMEVGVEFLNAISAQAGAA